MTIDLTSTARRWSATSELASIAVLICLGSLAALAQLVKPLRET
jgi:hypothetical protein